MAKSSSVFVCQQCGVTSQKWAGQCPNCGDWNSLVETTISGGPKRKRNKVSRGVKPIKLTEVSSVSEKRIAIGIAELDRVLGGGIVPGSVVLVAGEPGIGKSTLLTQLALHFSQGKGKSIYYICGEENPAQIKMRIDRIEPRVKNSKHNANISFLPELDVDTVVASVEKDKPGLVIVDSIQTVFTSDLTSSAGSVGQVRESAMRLIEVAKRNSIPIFLVGHVTKEGSIAGPKTLEHMVDTVLELSGDRQHEFRVLRANKNRFGTTDEVGIFAMEEGKMEEVSNPSDRFLAERQEKVPGSSVVCVLEGTRPMLVEVQALVVPSSLSVPRRVASGVDQRRVQLLVAVLTKRCGLRLGDKDIYVNVAGGLNIREPAVDFGIALAIASSSKNKALPNKSVVVGEIGLLGEIRKVGRLKQRITEAKSLGFTRVITSQEFNSLRKAIYSILR